MGADDATDLGMQNAVFLGNLEKWIDAIIMQDGLTNKQLVAKVKESFTRSIQANIEHHNYLSSKSDAGAKRDRHALMALIYKELLS